MVTGGCASNLNLKHHIEDAVAGYDIPVLTAPPILCTDNAAMIAWMGHELIAAG
jgi:N6-L-threonylcarbamoyladenine synthase